MAPNCPYKEIRGMKLCAHGIPGQLFYSLHVPIDEEDMANSPLTAVMTVLEGKGSVAKVTTELQYLISSTWDWQVKKVVSNEFMFVVPSAKELDMLTKVKEFKCKISDMLVVVERSDLMVGCSDVLSQVWVLVCGIPFWARKEKVVEEVAFLVGDFIEVDTKSLPGLGPIRVKVSCKDPASIKGSSKVYFNGRGFYISWNLENEKNEKRPFAVDKPGKAKDDEESWEDDEDEETDNYDSFDDDSKPADPKTTKEKPESSKQGEKRGDKQQDSEAMKTTEADVFEISKVSTKQGDDLIEKSSGIKQTGLGGDQVSQQEGMAMEDSFATEDNSTGILIQDAEHQMEVVDPSQESSYTAASAEVVGTQVGTQQVKEVEFIQVSSHKKQRINKQVQVAKIRSSRVQGTGTPIPLRAERRAAMADNQGTSSNPFTVLQNISSDVLSAVALECGIVLGDCDEEIDANIDLIKAKELAQATLAEAEKKKDHSSETVEKLEVNLSDDDFNEEHIQILEELEEVQDDASKENIEVETRPSNLEVQDVGRKGKKLLVSQ